MRFKVLGSILAIALAAPLVAQDATPDPFSAAIQDNTLDIARDTDGNLSGPGWDRLMTEADDAQFFLIGEQHATADIAIAAAKIHAGLAARDYEYMVVELGPWSTRHTEKLIREGTGELREYIATPGHQFILPFLMFAEEIDLVEQAVALSPHLGDALWGVDQEFLGAGPVILAELEKLAVTDDQKTAVAAFAAGSGANPMYLGVAPDKDIEALEAAFADASDDARELVSSIRLTHTVYGPFMRRTGTGYDANLMRENYMKDNFLTHFRTAEQRDGKAPKVSFKFGGYHLERGHSGTNVPSLGNFILEWSRSRGFTSVNVMMDCVGGEAYQIMQGGPGKCTSYALRDGSPILAALKGKEVALVDLAALRPMLSRQKELDDKTRDLILSYDYYLALSDVKTATPVADITLPDM